MSTTKVTPLSISLSSTPLIPDSNTTSIPPAYSLPYSPPLTQSNPVPSSPTTYQQLTISAWLEKDGAPQLTQQQIQQLTHHQQPKSHDKHNQFTELQQRSWLTDYGEVYATSYAHRITPTWDQILPVFKTKQIYIDAVVLLLKNMKLGVLGFLGVSWYLMWHIWLTRASNFKPVFLHISTAVFELPMMSYPLIILWGLFGWKRVKFLMAQNIFAYFFVLALAGTILMLGLQTTAILGVISYGVYLINLLIITIRFGQRHITTVPKRQFYLAYLAPYVLSVIFLILNDYLIIPGFLFSNSDFVRTLIRIVIHPVYHTFLLVVLRLTFRFIPTKTPYIIIVFPLYLKTSFGRMFNAETGAMSTVILNSIIVLVLDAVLRLVYWNRAVIFSKIEVGDQLKQKKIVTIIFESPASDWLYGRYLNQEKAMEFMAIIQTFAVEMLVAIFNPASPNGILIDYDRIYFVLLITGIQFAIELVGLYVITLLELSFNIPVKDSITDKTQTKWFCGVCMIAAFFLVQKMIDLSQREWSLGF